MKYIFGFDIGGTGIKTGVFSVTGELLKNGNSLKATEYNATIASISNFVREELALLGATEKDILGVGVGVPGPVCRGVVLECVNLGWTKHPIEQDLQNALQAPIRVKNDANLAALGEHFYDSSRDGRSTLMVTLGTGIGGGLILNHEIVEGEHGGAAELGHIPLSSIPEYNYDFVKQVADLEKISSASGLVYCANALISDEKYQDAKQVVDAAASGDADALRAIEISMRYLGYGLAAVADIIDPEYIIIGGGLSESGELILPIIERYFREKAYAGAKEAQIIRASLGNKAGIYGAAALFAIPNISATQSAPLSITRDSP